MGRKGGSKSLKRKPAPIFWPIHRKDDRWVVKPQAGPHKGNECIPLLVILRDMLSLGKTRREVDILLSRGNVKVDGIIKKHDDFPVGLMDVIEIPAIDKVFRVLPIWGKGLRLHEVPKGERDFKLCKIVGKTTVREGHIQLNLSDGRNLVVKVVDSKKPVEDVYKTSDLLRVSIPKVEVLAHLQFGEGVLALIDGGQNAGRWGEVVKIGKPDVYGSKITIKNAEDQEMETISNYVFPIGKDEAWISLPKGAEQ
ncbi:30S ribosomal protein S4e [Candidatus Bathyarchaeota archaeon]|nr:30S ribosomal protein S4e [Candidatus Bathyarchaeota archaeon]